MPGDLESLAYRLERRFPNVRPIRPLRILGSGFRSTAVETPAEVVFKVGRSPDAVDDYAKEWRIGRFLAQRLEALVPEPRWYAESSSDFPHGALGYRKLPGATPVWGEAAGAPFARDLGAFMSRLHQLSVDDALAAGVLAIDAHRRVLGARDVVMPVIATAFEHDAVARIEGWWAAFATDQRMRAPRTTVCHHDLWHDNLLRSPSGRLCGVLDIAHVEITDPAHDFAAPRYFGGAFTDELIASYRSAAGSFDAADAYRAQRFYEAREFGGLAWAIEHHDAVEIDSAIKKIRRGPILVDDSAAHGAGRR